MDLQAIRGRFSVFLKQFKIEDLKLLMKFLELIVNEYKNSRASRLFDLLSQGSNSNNEDFDFEFDNHENYQQKSSKLENLNAEKQTQMRQTIQMNKFQMNKLRRAKLLNARKKLLISNLHLNSIKTKYSSTKKNHLNGICKNDSNIMPIDESKKCIKIEDDQETSFNMSSQLEFNSREENDSNNLEKSNNQNLNDNIEEINLETDYFRNSTEQNNSNSMLIKANIQKQINVNLKQHNQLYNSINSNNNQRTKESINFKKSNNSNITNLNDFDNDMFNSHTEYVIDERIDDSEIINVDQNNEFNLNSFVNNKQVWNSNNKQTANNLKNKFYNMDTNNLNNNNNNNCSINMLNYGASKCAVCGDSAYGVRYGVNVCESCKEFFRRQHESTSLNKVLNCANGDNNCEITVTNRTQCRKCRLEKCFRLGMNIKSRLVRDLN